MTEASSARIVADGGSASSARIVADGGSASSARIVADADVLAADLLVGGPAREALDIARSHSWITLVASDALLDDAEAVIADLADADLARDWRERIDQEREPVDHPERDHPGLASAYRGGAAHLLSYDDQLRSAKAGLSIQPHADLSVRTPVAFVRIVDPRILHEVVEGSDYPGADRDPRA